MAARLQIKAHHIHVFIHDNGLGQPIFGNDSDFDVTYLFRLQVKGAIILLPLVERVGADVHVFAGKRNNPFALFERLEELFLVLCCSFIARQSLALKENVPNFTGCLSTSKTPRLKV